LKSIDFYTLAVAVVAVEYYNSARQKKRLIIVHPKG